MAIVMRMHVLFIDMVNHNKIYLVVLSTKVSWSGLLSSPISFFIGIYLVPMLFYLSRMTELDECFFPSGNDELDFELEGKDTMYGSNSILF